MAQITVNDAIQKLAAQNNQIWAALRNVESKLKEHEDAKQLKRLAPTFIEDIPGKRVPYTYVAQGTFTTTARTAITFQVSQDGPFVTTYLTAHWRPTAGANAGTWRPISQLGQLYAGAATDGVNFEYEIQAGGADRNWQNLPRASKDLFSDGDRPHYLGIGGFHERNETVIINITMLVAPTNAGLLKLEFHGYKILQPIAFAG